MTAIAHLSRRPARTWPGLIVDLLDGRDLSAADAAWAMEQVVLGEPTPAQVSGFLIALRAKGETPAELAGLASALRAQALPVHVPGPTIDVVGTGGDRLGLVNVATMAALVVAAVSALRRESSGARPFTVVKHGGRAASSRHGGSADLVEALGVPLDITPAEAARIAGEAGITFLFAPRFNPALRQVSAVRRELAVPTAFNVLAPLISPADPGFGLIGVADARLQPLIAATLAERGRSVLVVRGDDGLDKVTTTTTSRVYAVHAGEVIEHVLDPRELGLSLCTPADLAGGDSVGVLQRLLRGEPGPVRDVVLLNAAVALASLTGGPLLERVAAELPRCAEAVDSGAAAATLQRWVSASRSLGG